ncbi:MAG TPA: hypothetical protein VGD99_19155 [Anaerolineae bacterium]|jgi:hypothetical protein
MPPLTRWFIKLSMIYLVAGLLVGLLLAARSVWSMPPAVGTLAPVYFQ